MTTPTPPRPRVYQVSPLSMDPFNIDCPACKVRDRDYPVFQLTVHTTATAKSITAACDKALTHLATHHTLGGAL